MGTLRGRVCVSYTGDRHDEPYRTPAPDGARCRCEFERGLISERVREGLNNARRNGRHLGRPKAVERPHVAKHLPLVLADLDGARISKREACRRLKIGMPTLNRILADTKREAP
jgi:DNA invertase Pin-like site-specific DNA recombinase